MPQQDNTVQGIKDSCREFCELALKHYGKRLTYDEASLRWVEEMIIDKVGQTLTGEDQRSLIGMVGSFLGEALIASYGGEWKQDPKFGWGVYSVLGGENAFFPFAKTEKRFKQEEGESISHFFVFIPEVLRRRGK
jgi:hypothetical protein